MTTVHANSTLHIILCLIYLNNKAVVDLCGWLDISYIHTLQLSVYICSHIMPGTKLMK